MNQSPNCRLRTLRSHAGFSMAEILVGMVIGLIGIVAMFQVMDNWDQRKRTAASGSDAQIAGSIAMYYLERDIRQSGNGFGNAASMGCTVNAYDTVRGAAFTFPMVPLLIVDGAAGAPDQMVALYGNSATASISQSFGTSGVACSPSATCKKMTSTSSRGGIQRGDLMFVTNGATCGMIEITDNTNADQLTVNHATGAYTNSQNVAATARYNAAAGFTTASGQLFSLGNLNLPRRNVWQIANGKTLTATDDLHSTAAAEIGEGIVDLQAEYGLDTTATRDYLVDTWQATAPGDWTRVIAIRVALLARSQQYDKAAIPNYATCATDPAADPSSCRRPSWAGGSFALTNLDGTADSNPDSPNDWRHYRYSVYETTIPLRNMIWGTSP